MKSIDAIRMTLLFNCKFLDAHAASAILTANIWKYDVIILAQVSSTP